MSWPQLPGSQAVVPTRAALSPHNLASAGSQPLSKQGALPLPPSGFLMRRWGWAGGAYTPSGSLDSGPHASRPRPHPCFSLQ